MTDEPASLQAESPQEGGLSSGNYDEEEGSVPAKQDSCCSSALVQAIAWVEQPQASGTAKILQQLQSFSWINIGY
ncbi:hypothetical protein AV530_010804 [Patagioenas fasciata monilis]|nr:hypothetical protein AV530_010804 [Patagioenas fasciata monilis]